ncbi:Rpa49 subunit specific to nuclear RNA polymerase I [Macrolepiota fuliginosa MF-IS2]|uniref:Rpa49 subunit specific to nuclear RNA polymerase I n=1 Tax=Macrolepiota fuliginosa MF-IS2 TaxID=1400762 RepID=A0A9P5XJ43_9AGAR|nr:Rpa49 subunit specific to nuclear RNA polymerase I [Macrolepiota fuliginosa MF-IS2]
MADQKSTSKKRKRDQEPPTIAVANSSSHNPGPLLVIYPAVQPPASISFKTYARKKPRPDQDSAVDDVIIAGETDQVEFVTNEEESRRAAKSGCRYIVALHNKRTGAISLLPASRPPQILQRTVKALKSIQTTDAPTTPQYQQARTTLGETFGTKKAKAAIRAQERNKVDVSAMEGVMDYVMEGIEKGAEGLMTAEEAKEIADSNRLIPPFSATATEPDDVYPLHSIIPENEWKALSVSSFDEASDNKERIALLPHSRSEWVNARMRIWGQTDSGKDRKKNLKLLLYISALFTFRNAIERRDFSADQIRERLAALPGIVVDGLLSRFTEKARSSTSHQATSATKTFLLTNLLALCLKLDDFATNTETLSHDLNMSKDQANQLFRSLGCKISSLGERERARLGVSDSGETKYAILNTPVVFPKPRQKRRN